MSLNTCWSCGHEIFLLPVRLGGDGAVASYEGDARCAACGSPVPVGGSGVPDRRSQMRERADLVADASPGVWVVWRVYESSQLASARVAASELRTGKVKTLRERVGRVEARTMRRPDGSIEVSVRRPAL